MGTVYAMANQKGGVGKTTTAVNLAACVAEAGYDTLLIDIDPQCNATIALGLGKDAPQTLYDVLIDGVAIGRSSSPTEIERLHIAPSGPDLAGATVELPRLAGSETAPARRPRWSSEIAMPSSSSTARRPWDR